MELNFSSDIDLMFVYSAGEIQMGKVHDQSGIFHPIVRANCARRNRRDPRGILVSHGHALAARWRGRRAGDAPERIRELLHVAGRIVGAADADQSAVLRRVKPLGRAVFWTW